MLLQLLALLHKGGYITTNDMMHSLGIRKEQIPPMLEQLCNLGYISNLNSPHEKVGACGSCSACSSRNKNFPASIAHVWALTDKGRKALQSYN